MIRTIEIRNFKSIDELKLEIGRVNVFIGENGCGKTNILEAVGMAAAAASNKLDNEFLLSRGIRVTSPLGMRSGYERDAASRPIETRVAGTSERPNEDFAAVLDHEDVPFGGWINRAIESYRVHFINNDEFTLEPIRPQEGDPLSAKHFVGRELQRRLVQAALAIGAQNLRLEDFLTYTPHEEALRDLTRESWIEPVGIHGEGVFQLLQSLGPVEFSEVKQCLALIHWFADLELLPGPAPSQHSLKIVDQYLADGLASFDQRSANEGFLFLLLYACLLVSQHTPKFFAVDNVDAALNPKLAAGAVRMFADLTRKHDRQVLLTTHNPGTLDGLDLADDEQRLFVVYRNVEGRTRVRRIERDPAAKDPVRLSEAFLRGYLGGLPNHF